MHELRHCGTVCYAHYGDAVTPLLKENIPLKTTLFDVKYLLRTLLGICRYLTYFVTTEHGQVKRCIADSTARQTLPHKFIDDDRPMTSFTQQ